MSLIKRLLNNDYSLSIMKKSIMIILGLFISSLTVRALGLHLRGEQAYILNTENMLMLIFNFGVHHSYSVLRKRGYECTELKQKYYDFCAGMFLVYTLISILAFIFYSDDLLFLLFIMTTLNIYGGQLGNLLVIEDFKYHTILYTLNTVFNFCIVAVVYMFFRENLIAVLMTYIATHVFIILGCMLKLHIIPYPLHIDFHFSKEMLRLGFFPMLIGLLNVMNYNFDTIMLKSMSVPFDKIGLYSIGTSLAGYLWLLPDIFKEISFSRSAKGDSIQSVCFSLRLSNTLTMALMFIILLLGKLIIFILYGEVYVPAYEVTLLILLGVPSLGIFKIVNPVYTTDSRSRYVFVVLLFSVLSNIILNYILIPVLSIYGAAIASLVSYSICGIVVLRNFKKSYHVEYKDVLLINKNDIRKIISFIFKT